MKLMLRVIFAFIGVFLVIALVLYLNGVTQVEFTDKYYAFFQVVVRKFDNFKISIPNIPHIPMVEVIDNVFLQILDAIVKFLNGLVDFINLIILVVNYLIQIIEFCLIFISSIFVDLPRLYLV